MLINTAFKIRVALNEKEKKGVKMFFIKIDK
jgi:hypothetical protein